MKFHRLMYRALRHIVAVGVITFCGTVLVSCDDDNPVAPKDAPFWELESQLQVVPEFTHKLKYANNTFIGLQDYNGFFSSADGARWTQSRINGFITNVIWTGDRWLLLASDGIYSSTDAIHWTQVYVGGWIFACTEGTNGLVAVQTSGVIIRSVDGSQWDSVGFASTGTLTSVVWTGDRYVAAGVGAIWTSDDGETWVERYDDSTLSGWSMELAFTDEGLVANSPHFYEVFALHSDDGISWDTSSIGVAGGILSAVGGLFFVSSSNGLNVSSDGLTWQNVAQDLASPVYSENGYVSVGRNGTVARSLDGYDWTIDSIPTDEDFQSVCWSGTDHIAVSDNGLVIESADGVNWRPIARPLDLNSVACAQDKSVAVGDLGAIVISTNGTAWSAVESDFLADLNAVVWAGSAVGFVAVGAGGAALRSGDGESWNSEITGTTEELNAVCWTGTRLVAVGSHGAIYSSYDGQSWNAEKVITDFTLNGIAYANGQFVVVGDQGFIGTSLDLSNWVVVVADYTSTLLDVCHFNFGDTISGFVAVGPEQYLLTSQEGLYWKQSSLSAEYSVTAVTATEYGIIAVAGTRYIVSDDAETWTWRDIGMRDALGRKIAFEDVAVVPNTSSVIAVGSGGAVARH